MLKRIQHNYKKTEMFHMRTFLTIILILLSALANATNDTIHIATRINDGREKYGDFISYEKPSVKVLKRKYSLTSVSVGTTLRNESRAVMPQFGKGEISGNFNANTFITNKKGATWGNASYTNGKIVDVQFNETSDYAMLYPYTLGDSVGGDLRFQNYRFGGGVNTALNSNWKLGIEAQYRADLAYRQIDPRPKNLVTDLDATIGASRRIAGKYLIGLDLNAGKYKQTNSLRFFSELGVPNVVHFTGLGTQYYRFQGSNYSTYYKGYRVGGSLGIVPDGSGWYGFIAYNYFAFTKIISSLNELPMARAGEHQTSGEIAYLNTEPTAWGIKLNADYCRKSGTENIFGDAADNVYPLIMSLEQFSAENLHLQLSALYGQTAEIHDWNISAKVCYLSHSEKYNSPAQHLILAHTGGKVGVQYGYKGKSLHIGISTDLGFYASTSHDLLLYENTIWQNPIRQTYEILSGHFLQSDTSFRISYSFGNDIAIFLDARYSYTKFFGNTNQHITSISIGVNL